MREFVVSSVWVCKTELQPGFFFLQSVHPEFLVSRDAFVYILPVGDILNLTGKTDFSGVRFHVHPGAAVILSPRGQISAKTDKERNCQGPQNVSL